VEQVVKVTIMSSKIAIFGDVHGALDNMYRWCVGWEAKNSPIAFVLQCGDMGVFPSLDRVDHATRVHAAKDPTELHVVDYIVGDKIVDYPTIFVRGNHEDHRWLSEFPDGGYLDPYDLFWYLTAIAPQQRECGGAMVTIAGLGGISDRRRERDWNSGGLVQSDVDALLKLAQESVDILLLHDAPDGNGLRHDTNTGSAEITLVIEHLQPRFAFYGHYNDPPDPFTIGRTQCVGMNNANVKHLPKRDAGMGILDPETWEFEFLR
jgi:hypothetical protein